MSFFEFHSARVQKDMLIFLPMAEGVVVHVPPHTFDLLAPPPWQIERLAGSARDRLLAMPVSDEFMDTGRERDRLLLFRAREPSGPSFVTGIGMFSAATVLAAHAPGPLRVLFDGPIHLGPAIFDSGGMGAGIGGRGL